jgi:CubicO group peptidase (beta-lactamase class C family)
MRFVGRNPRESGITRHAALCVTLLTVSASAGAQPTIDALPLAETRLGSRDPGCATSVISHGHTLLARGYGTTDVDHGSPIDARTNFRLASVSKQFTAMAIMLLVHDGRLTYATPLAEMLPGFPDYARQVTLRNLLNHTSGLPDYEALMDALERGGGRTYSADHQIQDREVLTLLQQQQHLKFPPGTRWAYSNSGYVLLGLIVSTVSGKSFAQFLSERICKPLGMQDTLVYVRDANSVSHRAFGHERIAAGFRRVDQSATSATQGDGGIYSNLEDLARWDAALETHRLLSVDAMRPALEPVRLADGSESRWPDQADEDNLAPGQPVAYGFGWFLDPYRGHRRMWHFGSTQGFRTTIVRFPSDHVTAIVLCNRMDIDARAVALQLASDRLARSADSTAP